MQYCSLQTVKAEAKHNDMQAWLDKKEAE